MLLIDSPGGRTREKAQRDLIHCNRASKDEFVLDPKEFKPSLPRQHFITTRARQRRTYTALGRFAEKKFLDSSPFKYPRTIRDASGIGFRVLGRMLAAAPPAYLEYCDRNSSQPDLEELGTALKDSTETPEKFLNLPKHTNTEVEEAFHLRDYLFGVQSPHLRFEDGEQGSPLYRVDEEYFQRFASVLIYSSNLDKQWQRCPARRLVTERVWPAMVDLAVQTPEVFARDLGIT